MILLWLPKALRRLDNNRKPNTAIQIRLLDHYINRKIYQCNRGNQFEGNYKVSS